MKTILFVCTGNTCRSSMAEALFRDLLEKEAHNLGDVRVISAGTSALKGDKAARASMTVMEERGISLREHQATPLTKGLIDEADLILTMTTNHKNTVLDICPEAKEKVYTLKEYVHNGKKIDDILDVMNEIYREIDVKKKRFISENQGKIKELKQKREDLMKELKMVEQQVTKLEEEFESEIMDYEDELIRLKSQLPQLDIMDPFGQPVDVYRRCAEEIEESLKKLLKKISKK